MHVPSHLRSRDFVVLITSFSLPFCVVHSISPGLVSLPDGLDGFLRRALRRILGVSRDQLQFGCLRSHPPQPVQCSGPVARQILLGLTLDVLFFGDIEQFLNLVLAKNPITKFSEVILSLSILLPEVRLQFLDGFFSG